MNIKKSLLIFLLLSLSLLIPKVSRAVDFSKTPAPKNSIITRIQESVEYFFAFKAEKKVKILEKHAEKRLIMAQDSAQEGANIQVQDLLKNYLHLKEKQNNLLEKNTSEQILGTVEEKTIDQQKIMEEIKTKIDDDTKQQVVQTQEQVVNQVAQRVVDVNGQDGLTEFFQKVEHVWAPGTDPVAGGSRGESGVVIEGGKMQFAPGTSGGGPSGTDIKTVEIKTSEGNN